MVWPLPPWHPMYQRMHSAVAANPGWDSEYGGNQLRAELPAVESAGNRRP